MVAGVGLARPDLVHSVVYDLVGLSAVVAILCGCGCTGPPAGASGTAWRCSSPATVVGVPDAADRRRPLADPGVAADLARLPLADVLLLAVLARLVTSPGARSASYRMLGAALLLQLGADIGYAELTAVGAHSGGLSTSAGWSRTYAGVRPP